MGYNSRELYLRILHCFNKLGHSERVLTECHLFRLVYPNDKEAEELILKYIVMANFDLKRYA